MAASVFHAAQHQHLGAAGRHLEHFLEGHGVELSGVAHDARVGAEDAVHVGVDLTDIGTQRGGHGDGGGVRAAAAQRRDILGVLADPLESGHQNDPPLLKGGLQPPRRDVDDLGVAVGAGGDHPGLRTGERPGMRAERLDGHGHQRIRDAFTGGKQHVQLPRRRRRAHLLSQIQQVVGGIPHGRDDDDDVIALLLGGDDAFGDAANPFGVGHRGSAVLLHDERHCFPFREDWRQVQNRGRAGCADSASTTGMCE